MEDTIIPRTTPEPPEARADKILKLCKNMRKRTEHWKHAFDRIRENRRFARGKQWPEPHDGMDEPYVANYTHRHISQRVATTYARNPKSIFRRRKSLDHIVWDENPESLEQAYAILSAANAVKAGVADEQQISMIMGQPDIEGSRAIIQEVAQVAQRRLMLKRHGDTLVILYEYYVGEQNRSFKSQMKRLVRRSATCGLAYIRPSFQRVTGRRPEDERKLEDARRRLEVMERLSADLADQEVEPDAAEAEELRVGIEQMQQQPEITLREGLTFEYPDPTHIIPDENMTNLNGFEGCDQVAQAYLLRPSRVQEIYGVDVRGKYEKYTKNSKGEFKASTSAGGGDKHDDEALCCVWEIYDKPVGLVNVVCDGWPDYLVQPQEPDVWVEGFWPWFPYIPNDSDDPDDPYPLSEVELMKSPQQEVNRAGEGLREHRFAARPGYVSMVTMDEADRMKIQNREPFSVIDLKAAHGATKPADVFAPLPTVGIDPGLYTTGPAMDDIMRTVGSQEANLGGMSGATATEASIGESSRQSSTTSARDELDDLLRLVARASGQILLLNMGVDAVREIVGPGAVWPEQDREMAAKEILLEVEAGSSGRPNQAQEVQVRERLYPLLMQLPGLSAAKMVQDLVSIMDDRIEITDWMDTTALSIIATNGEAQAMANQAPAEEGAKGASNAPTGPGRQTGGMPRTEEHG